MNPLLDDVARAFARIPTRPRAISIDRRGVALPAGGHFQGIQRLAPGPLRLAISSSSDSRSYLVLCDLADDGSSGRARPPIRLADAPMHHAGGCQAVGHHLVVGVEDDDAKTTSQVQFWNLAGAPGRLDRLTIDRRGRAEVSTAGAVGLTSYRGGAALVVATWDAGTIDLYTCAQDPFLPGAGPFRLQRTWSRAGADKTGWVDANVGDYQSVNLVTQANGTLFLIGFNRSGGDDWMDLFALDAEAPPARMLRKVAKKHMYCTNGCTFRHGAGVFVASSSQFEVYAVNGDSGDHQNGTRIHVNHFH